MLIGDLAKKADVSIDTIRYYERLLSRCLCVSPVTVNSMKRRRTDCVL